MTWFAIIALDHLFILLIIIHPQCYLCLHKVFIHCPCPLLLCGKIHFHRWKVNVLFLWAFSKAIISALCSYLLFCASIGSVFTSFLLLSFSWRLRILTGYAQGKWEHLILKCRRLLKIFCPVSEHWSNSINSSNVGQTPTQLVKVPCNRRFKDWHQNRLYGMIIQSWLGLWLGIGVLDTIVCLTHSTLRLVFLMFIRICYIGFVLFILFHQSWEKIVR